MLVAHKIRVIVVKGKLEQDGEKFITVCSKEVFDWQVSVDLQQKLNYALQMFLVSVVLT